MLKFFDRDVTCISGSRAIPSTEVFARKNPLLRRINRPFLLIFAKKEEYRINKKERGFIESPFKKPGKGFCAWDSESFLKDTLFFIEFNKPSDMVGIYKGDLSANVALVSKIKNKQELNSFIKQATTEGKKFVLKILNLSLGVNKEYTEDIEMNEDLNKYFREDLPILSLSGLIKALPDNLKNDYPLIWKYIKQITVRFPINFKMRDYLPNLSYLSEKDPKYRRRVIEHAANVHINDLELVGYVKEHQGKKIADTKKPHNLMSDFVNEGLQKFRGAKLFITLQSDSCTYRLYLPYQGAMENNKGVLNRFIHLYLNRRKINVFKRYILAVAPESLLSKRFLNKKKSKNRGDLPQELNEKDLQSLKELVIKNGLSEEKWDAALTNITLATTVIRKAIEALPLAYSIKTLDHGTIFSSDNKVWQHEKEKFATFLGEFGLFDYPKDQEAAIIRNQVN